MDEEVGTPGGNFGTSGTNDRSVLKYEPITARWLKVGVAAGNTFLVRLQRSDLI